MSELPNLAEKLGLKQKQGAIESMVLSLVTGAKSVLLYKPGHAMINQVAERTHKSIITAVGMDPTLTLEVKAKQILVNENPIAETKEVVTFAGSLHTLGIGQILLTNRVTLEGVIELFRVLTLKADEKNTLSDIQKSLQGVHIDGVQLVFILSFVVTGDQDVQSQPPGVLTEEQLQAYIKAPNLADFLHLLFKQNEAVIGKEADAVTELLDGVLNRDTPLERFEAEMLWQFYDPRIRSRFDELAKDVRRPPVEEPLAPGAKRASRPRWNAHSLIGHIGFILEGDQAAVKDHKTHEKTEATRHALELARQVIDKPAGPHQSKFGAFSYLRLLAELVYEGDMTKLLREYDYWLQLLGGEKASSVPQFQASIRERIVNSTFAGVYVGHIAKLAKDGEEFKKMEALALFLGENIVAHLVEQLRGVQDKDHRLLVCQLLTNICPKLTVKPLVEALNDFDWFLVVNAAEILKHIGAPENFPPMIPLIQHSHHKVRETVIRIMAKFGNAEAADGLADFIVKTESAEEAGTAITSLSMISAPGNDARLIAVYKKLSIDNRTALASYETRVRIASVMGRMQATGAALAFLEEVAQRGWYETLTEFFGAVNQLKLAARISLSQLRKEAKPNGAAG